MCYNCKKLGHPARQYLNNVALLGHESKVKGNMGFYCKDLVEGSQFDQILLDTGCSCTTGRRQLLPQLKILNGKMVSIKCAHGDTVLFPLTELMVVEGIPVHVEVAVVNVLPVGVLLDRRVSVARQTG